MTFFARTKGEDYEDEEDFDDEENGEERRLTKEFRDLKPENKKRRKEPPKPWGKKERIIVLIVLLVTVIISAILTFSAVGKARFHLTLPRFNLKSLGIFKEETIIIRKE